MNTPSFFNISCSTGKEQIREKLERREYTLLSPYAAKAAESRGRERAEEEPPYRTAYQRDRDRILHAKAFRRLKHKTQVFLATAGDHYRTRLTHTLEVSQIARIAARALFLNEDLVEAIALGHDLGHTPFGHAGEAILNEMSPAGFSHAAQSLRIVDTLESTRHGPGLNLTYEVRDGIRQHSKGKGILYGEKGPFAATLEGDLVSICDAIAYINHDIDDAIRGGIITTEDLPRDAVRILGQTPSERINSMVGALIAGSRDGHIDMVDPVKKATRELRDYLYANLYPSEAIHKEIRKARHILRTLYTYLRDNPSPELLKKPENIPWDIHLTDFVAGMTDQYAIHLYKLLFFPESWP